MAQLFVEVNPYHAVTLYPYYSALARTDTDTVLAHPRLFQEPLFNAIAAPKKPISLLRMIRLLRTREFDACHFNTINLTLFPVTLETIRLGFATLLFPIVARCFGCRLTAIIHEADHFFVTGLSVSRRTRIFRKCIGSWFVRCFQTIYVLSPEVAAFLGQKGARVECLDSTALRRFAESVRSRGPRSPTVAWIGPVVGLRRNWGTLLELDPRLLEAHGVCISIVCDARRADGPTLRAEVENRELASRFVFRDYRPDDNELFAEVLSSLGVLCLYGGADYGRTKTSGARLIAQALGKPFIANTPSLGVYRADGTLLTACSNLNDCIVQLAKNSSSVCRSTPERLARLP